MSMEGDFPRESTALEDVFGLVTRFLESEGIDEGASFNVNLIVEELFTNAVKYSPRGAQVGLFLARDADRVTIQLVDRDVDRFDITVTVRGPGSVGSGPSIRTETPFSGNMSRSSSPVSRRMRVAIPLWLTKLAFVIAGTLSWEKPIESHSEIVSVKVTVSSNFPAAVPLASSM